MNVRLNKDDKKKLKSTDDVYDIMQKILLRQNKLRRKQEYFWTIGLSPKLDIEYIELVALGKLNVVAAEPVEIFSVAVSKRCKSMIMVHNHPSGGLKPSKQDLKFTKDLQAAAKILQIEILDHLIITEIDYYSIVKKSARVF
jgi:DNA repair protein RadC